MMNYKILIGLMLVGMLLLTGCYDQQETKKDSFNLNDYDVYDAKESYDYYKEKVVYDVNGTYYGIAGIRPCMDSCRLELQKIVDHNCHQPNWAGVLKAKCNITRTYWERMKEICVKQCGGNSN